MKKTLTRGIVCMVLCLVLAAQWLPIGAAAATSTWEYYTNPDGDGGHYVVITAYNGSGGSVTIPNTLGGAKVQGFSTYTFYYSDAAITSLSFSSNLQWISGAFCGCENLTSFSWPKGVKTVGSKAFGAKGLTSVSIPSTVTRLGGDTYGLTGGVFEDCTKLTSVTINATQLTQISESTFEGCTALKSIKIPAGVTSIGDNAFGVSFNSQNIYCGIGNISNLYFPDTVQRVREQGASLSLRISTTTMSNRMWPR